jgi:hypothetical protein
MAMRALLCLSNGNVSQLWRLLLLLLMMMMMMMRRVMITHVSSHMRLCVVQLLINSLSPGPPVFALSPPAVKE